MLHVLRVRLLSSDGNGRVVARAFPLANMMESAPADPPFPFPPSHRPQVSTKITVIETLINKVDKLVIGGGMVFTFLKARGHNVRTLASRLLWAWGKGRGRQGLSSTSTSSSLLHAD